jgi:endonuclease YncB( thermonuclease family)
MKLRFILAIVLFVLPACVQAAPLTIEGEAKVIDGRTIEIWGQRIRLWGIAAIPPGTKAAEDSTRQLRRLIADVIVRCKSMEASSLRFTVARCYVGGIDIAWPLVLTGSAQDDSSESGGYYAGRK